MAALGQSRPKQVLPGELGVLGFCIRKSKGYMGAFSRRCEVRRGLSRPPFSSKNISSALIQQCPRHGFGSKRNKSSWYITSRAKGPAQLPTALVKRRNYRGNTAKTQTTFTPTTPGWGVFAISTIRISHAVGFRAQGAGPLGKAVVIWRGRPRAESGRPANKVGKGNVPLDRRRRRCVGTPSPGLGAP